MKLFYFLRYISPVWYYHLEPKKDHNYFPSEVNIDKLKIEVDKGFASAKGRELDFSWRIFQSGYISLTKSEAKENNTEPLLLTDEYRFVRKYFNPIWVYFIFSIRICSLRNPIAEIKALLNTRGTQRVKYQIYNYEAYNNFESKLLKSQPLVTVVIPTLNRYPYLDDVLKDLERQTYSNFEVLVVDQSEPFQSQFYENRNINLTYWLQPEKALWKARNDAIKRANGDLLLLYDDDSRVEPDWMEQHIRAIDFFSADISSGVSISAIGAKVPEHYSHFRWSDQLDTGNVMIRRSVFNSIGLFDRQFERQRMGDGEFGLRAYTEGFRNISNPYAKRLHLKVSGGGLRQMGSWDAWRPKKLFAPRPIPSVLYFYRKYFGEKAALRSMFITLIPSVIPYKRKGNPKWFWMAILLFPIFIPVVLLQGIFSWRLATRKLKEGHRIERL